MNSELFLMLPSSTVKNFEITEPNFHLFLERYLVPDGLVRRFPDGAIELNYTRLKVGEYHPLVPFISPGRIEGAGGFRSLGPFQSTGRLFSIQYLADYQDRLKSEVGFLAGKGSPVPISPDEFELESLSIHAYFLRRLNQSVRLDFTRAIAEWGNRVAIKGAFDDGPIQLASPGITFSGVHAHFTIDASRSGQDTLNWLTLTILDFGYEVHVVTWVWFGNEIARPGSKRSESVFVGFMEALEPTKAQAAQRETVEDFVPPGAVPDAFHHSERFAILTLHHNEWDSFKATIYFAHSPDAQARRELRALINAWNLLGSYGGLGGKGTHGADKLVFDDAQDAAILRSDMGDVDPEIALVTLIRSLEGFERGGTPINAVVFGSSPPWKLF